MAETIGTRIRAIRGDLSQEDFANRMGVHEQTIGKYERGIRQPDAEFLTRLQSDFGVDMNWLLSGHGQMRLADAASAAPAAEASPTVDASLYGQVLEQVAAIYRECGVTASLAQIGAQTADIVNRLAASDLPTDEHKRAALHGALFMLRNTMSPNNDLTKPGDAQGKQRA